MLDAGELLVSDELSLDLLGGKPRLLAPPKRRPPALAAVVVETGLAVDAELSDDLAGSSFFSSTALRFRLWKKPLLGADDRGGERVTDDDVVTEEVGVVLRPRFTDRGVVVLEVASLDRDRDEARLVLR